jgi:hypothetical protein
MARRTLEIEPPYREALAGILSFSTFAAAEATLRQLDNLCRNYRSKNDKKGADYCRQIAFLGRRRAEFVARNRRVGQSKRLQKQEIATWFQRWLETPAIFEDWLALRKNTSEFKSLLQAELDEGSRSQNSPVSMPNKVTRDV